MQNGDPTWIGYIYGAIIFVGVVCSYELSALILAEEVLTLFYWYSLVVCCVKHNTSRM